VRGTDEYSGVMSVLPARHPVTADEFERMVEAGVFATDGRLELIDGEILDMSPIGSAHVACVSRLTHLFAGLAVASEAIVQAQGAFRADDLSRPQPDLALLRWRDDFYAAALARPDDVLLVVEVADSSLRFDRTVKRPAYARACVAETWIVDLNRGAVEVARRPSADGYGTITTHARGEVLAPQAFPGVAVAVADVLG
jgi:Uma2 family endonuclease